MADAPTYYSGTGAAAQLGVKRSTLNFWVSENRQSPDAVLVSADRRKPDQPIWLSETLANWGNTTIIHEDRLYATAAAKDFLGLPPQTFNHYRKRIEIPADGWLQRSPTSALQPIWRASTLTQWLKEIRASLESPHLPKPVDVYSLTDSAMLMGITTRDFLSLTEELGQMPDAVLFGPLDQAYTASTLSEVAKHSGHSLKRRKPKPTSLISTDQAAVLLGIPAGEFSSALRQHPLAPEAVIVSPASQAWTEQTLKDWAEAHRIADGEAS